MKPRFNVFNVITGELAVMRRVHKSKHRPNPSGSKSFELFKITFFRGPGPKVRGFTFQMRYKKDQAYGYWVKL